jgi:hypothetical protein
MRKHFICAALALAMCLASAGAASAKLRTRTLTFGSDFLLGETLVKAGTYRVSYDDKTGELSVADRSDKSKTLARASVRVEQRGKSVAGWDVVLAQKGGGLSLVSLAFPGDRQNLVVGDAAAAGATSAGAPASSVGP